MDADVVVTGMEIAMTKYSPLIWDFHRWLIRLINPIGLCRKTPEGIRAMNLKANILADQMKRFTWNGNRLFLKRFTKTLLEMHLTELDGEFAETYYFTGGVGGSTLVMVDIDTHDGELGGPAAVEAMKHICPEMFFQVSTNNRGFHGYLVLDYGTKGERPSIRELSTVNELVKQLDAVLKLLIRSKEIAISDIEIKGLLQHGTTDGTYGGYYGGVAAKIPRVKDIFELMRLKATTRMNSTQLMTMVRQLTKAMKPLAATASIPQQEEGTQIILGNTSIVKRRLNAGSSASANTARRLKAAWELAKKQRRAPNPIELEHFLLDNNIFSPPWEYNQDKRRADCVVICAKIAELYKPMATITDYSEFAKQIIEGHDIRYADEKKVVWADLAIYLSIIHSVAIDDSNADGSIPKRRMQQLWARYATRLKLNRSWQDRKNRVIREFLIDLQVLDMMDRSFGSRKAMRFTIGPSHPCFGKVKRTIVPRIAVEDLLDGFILDRV